MHPYFFLGGQRGLTALSTGEKLYVNTEDRSITPWLIFGGRWEVFVDDILCSLARPGDVFVDAGANIGYYTVKMGSLVGERGKVFSFEPNPATFDLLRDNIAINAFESRSHLYQAALGSGPGEAWLTVKPREPGGSHISQGADGLNGEVLVPVQSLDDTLPEDLVVDLIKIDVEGFEPPALQGMSRVLARSPGAAMVVEMAYDLWQKFGDPSELMAQAAGERLVYRIHHDGSLEPVPLERLTAFLEDTRVSYFLLLPKERVGELDRFMPGYVEPPPPEPPPPPPASLPRRALGRLLRAIAARLG